MDRFILLHNIGEIDLMVKQTTIPEAKRAKFPATRSTGEFNFDQDNWWTWSEYNC